MPLQWARRLQSAFTMASLSCLAACGGGGNPAVTLQAPQPFVASTYSVPTDVSKLSYPSSYTTPSTSQAEVNTDPCRLDLDVVSYPKSWLGQSALPAIHGAPFKKETIRGIYLKDIMLSDNPVFVGGCTGSLQSEFAKTIARAKKLGVDHIYVPQWHWAAQRNDGRWYIMRAEDSFGPLRDSDLSFFVSKAHEVGLKVIMMNQIQGMMNNDNSSAFIPTKSLDNFRKWLPAYDEFMAERAVFFAALQIDAWEIGCNACFYMDDGDGTDAARQLFQDQYIQTIKRVKSLYNGKIMTHANNSWMRDAPEFLDQVDIIVNSLYGEFTNETIQNPSVSNIKSAFKNGGFAQNAADFKSRGKTILVNFGLQSRANALTEEGYLEETACTAGVNQGEITSTVCAQRNTPPDFALQATYFEAALEYLQELEAQMDLIVFAGEYWETDSLISDVVFPNIGATIRNKPAEGIVKAWFQK